MSTTTTKGEFFAIEKTGERLQVWGPYPTLAKAKHEAGVRCFVAIGENLENGQTISRHDLATRLAIRSIVACD